MSDERPETQISAHAHSRIASSKAKHLFTCDLSINEFLLVKEAGFDPLGLVMGTSIYHVVPSVPNIAANQPGCEHYDMTKALYHARELAMGRMKQEAEELGGDGIIGVRLVVNLDGDPYRLAFRRYREWQDWAHAQGFPRRVTNLGANWFNTWLGLAQAQWTQFCARMNWPWQPPPWTLPQKQATYALGQNVVEFMAIGTAVKHRGSDGVNYKNKRGKPFQSALSGQEFWTLVRAGYRPVGFVMGNCVYYIPPWLLRAPDAVSGELGPYTHALYDARELAIERLQWEAEALGATGVIDVTVSEHSHAWMRSYVDAGNAALRVGEMLELFVIGTAVVPMPGAEAKLPTTAVNEAEGHRSGSLGQSPKLIHVVTDRRAEQKLGGRTE